MSPGSGCLWMTVWEWPTLISSLTPSSQNALQGPPSEPLGLGKSLDDRFFTSSSHILPWIFACSLLCWSQLSEKKHSGDCLLWANLLYYLKKKKKTVLVIFGCLRSLVLSTLFSSWGKWGCPVVEGASLQRPLCCRVGSRGHGFQ